MVISNHNCFRVLYKNASVYFVWKIYWYFSTGTGQPSEPELCQLYRHTFVPSAIAAAVPRLWNGRPTHLRQPDFTLNTFCRKLYACFVSSRHQRSVTVAFLSLSMNSLTYTSHRSGPTLIYDSKLFIADALLFSSWTSNDDIVTYAKLGWTPTWISHVIYLQYVLWHTWTKIYDASTRT